MQFHIALARQPDTRLRQSLPLIGAVLMTCLIGECTGCGGASVSDEADAKAADAQSVDDILKRFIDECVEIRPGEEEFPAEFRYGPVSDAEFSGVTPRTVTMSEPFRICRYETTQELYEAVTGNNPSRWKGRRNSAEHMTFDEATAFCQRLTALLRSRGLLDADAVVRLPTGVEWEYCCRAGTNGAYSFPVDDSDPGVLQRELDLHSWSHGNAAGNDPPVGALRPNPWGLYDMHGYLWEFVSDDWHPGDTPAAAALSVPVIRGGSWREDAAWHTCAAGIPVPPHVASDAIGFRCVIDQGEQDTG